MIYTIDISRWGGFFNVPISVAQNCLKLSSGNQLKVLLYILSQGLPKVDCAEVAATLGISDEDAEEAVLYWHSLGILDIQGKEKGKLSLSEKKVPKAAVSVQTDASKAKKLKLTYNPSDISKLAQSCPEIKNIFEQAQSSLCRPIYNADQILLLNLYEYYGFPAATIIMLCDYCHSINCDKPAYIEKVAKSWFDEGIIDPKEADTKVKYLMEYHSFENDVKRALGLGAKTTSKQAKYFESWKKRGFSSKLIEYAGELSIDGTDKHVVSLEYMDTILSSWEDNGIKTVDDAKKTNINTSPTAKKNTSKKSYISEDALSKYDDDVDKYLKMHGLL